MTIISMIYLLMMTRMVTYRMVVTNGLLVVLCWHAEASHYWPSFGRRWTLVVAPPTQGPKVNT